MTKVCKICGQKLPLIDFYEDKTMRDGHVNQCKECIQKRARERRWANIERVREKDRQRGKLEHRQELKNEITARRRHEVPGYQKAHNAINRAIEHGSIERSNTCQVCGNQGKTEAHHHDYDITKSVVWLCPVCHRMYHLGKSERADKVRVIVDMILSLRTTG